MSTGRIGRGLALAVMAATAHTGAAAQVARPLLSAPDRIAARPVSFARSAPVGIWGREPREAAAGVRRSLATSASVVGGAVVGAWLGYFLSQVVKSDWEGMRAGERAVHRRRFAFSGAAVGAIAGYLVRPRPRAPGVREPRPPFFYVPRSSRHYITSAELRRAPVVNALDAVQTLRPEWLESTQIGVHAAAQRALLSEAADTGIAVYVVDTRVGGPAALAEISIPELEELRLYEPQDAERRWGNSHPRGAIEVVPAAPGVR